LVLGKPYKLKYRIVIDNSIKFIISNAEVLYDDENKPIKLIRTVIDVTENITFENKLIKSDKRFRGAFENSPTGLSVTSLKGKFIKVSHFTLSHRLGMSHYVKKNKENYFYQMNNYKNYQPNSKKI